jgi:peptide/nickel transport system ATP-binding protein
MSRLSADGLSVAAGTHRVLRDVSFRLEPGKVLGIVGESGAGKSMVGRAIAGALPAGFRIDGGALRYGGEDLVAMKPARRRALLGREIAFIPQEPMAALNPVMTIGQQMGEHLARIGTPKRRERMIDLLDAVRLREPEALLARYPHQLSGGMCQRVLIAMAFASDPKLVVADEPTTALDVTVQAQVVRVIRELQARVGTAMVFITHDLRLAGRLCDELLVLYAGRPAESGPAPRVLAAPAHPYTRCLQLAAPDVAGPRRGLYELPGQMPGLSQIAALPGCRFAPRCPVTSPDCREAEPPFADGVACLHPERTAGIAPPRVTAAPKAADSGDLLRAEQLARVFTSRSLWRTRRTVAVTGESFAIGAGEFVGLVGESGSGKSTVARLVMGLERPTSGRILLDGAPLPPSAAQARARRLAAMQMVFQDPQSALNPRRTVADIVTQALRASGASRAAREARGLELLRQVGLPPEAMMRLPSQLSGGQRQRVNIARALCTVPRLLVADEIVSGLDVSVQAQLLDLLLRLRSEIGFAMLFISHDLAVVRYLCSRVLVMRHGVIVEQGETEAVFAQPAHDYTRTLLASV